MALIPASVYDGEMTVRLFDTLPSLLRCRGLAQSLLKVKDRENCDIHAFDFSDCESMWDSTTLTALIYDRIPAARCFTLSMIF